MHLIDFNEAKRHFSRLVERAAAGEEIVIGKAGKPVARLVPYQSPRQAKRRPGSMKGKIKFLPGFDAADKEIEAMFYGEQ